MHDWKAALGKYLEAEEPAPKTAQPPRSAPPPPYRPPEPQRQAIRAFLKKRNVAVVFHFTPVENLASICEHGLLSRAHAEALDDPSIVFPDRGRLDGATWAVCCSIQWPNYKMLYWVSKRHECALLALDPSVLWDFDCVFVPHNASSHDIRGSIEALRADKRGRAEQLKQLFPGAYDYAQWSAYTEDVQAEVLVDASPIPLKYCRTILFKSLTTCLDAETLPWPSHIQCQYYPDVFTYRPDHRFDYREMYPEEDF